MRTQSNRPNNRQDRQDPVNEHLGYNEARYAGQAYNQDHNQSKNEWQDDDEPGYHAQNQRSNNFRQPGNNYRDRNNSTYNNNNHRDNRNAHPQDQNHLGRETGYRDWNDDLNADRRIQGSRNYMREEHAYGQSNDSMYEANRGNRRSRQNYQDDYNYNNNAQYPYRNDLEAYDTHFDNPENFRKQRRRGFGSRYER